MDGHREGAGKSHSFTGRRRQRTTRRSVRLVDRLARAIITFGGIGSILAVSMVGLFLIWVVLPLFLPPGLSARGQFSSDGGPGDPTALASEVGRASPAPLHLGVNEHRTMAWLLREDGSLEVRYLADGRVLTVLRPSAEVRPTAWSFGIEGEQCAFGFADGTVQYGRIRFVTEFLSSDAVPEELRYLQPGDHLPWRDGVVRRTPENQLRWQHLRVELGEPIAVSEAPILLLDQVERTGGPAFAALDSAGMLHVNNVSERKNLLTGAVTTRLTGGRLALDPAESGSAPVFLMMTGSGDNVFVAAEDGRLWRFDSRDVGDLRLAETVDLVPEPSARLTCLAFQIGRSSLVAGDSAGRLSVWFRTRPAQAATVDLTTLVQAYTLPAGKAAVTALAASARTRMMAAGFADGSVHLYHTTSQQRLASARLEGESSVPGVAAVILSPREDALLAAGQEFLGLWDVDTPHPETTFASLLRPIWYEGYNEPAYVWQSSSATDEFEPKYSLVPLIFGTLKATLYSLLFGLPLALLAAIYTSEFLHPRVKSRVKPVIELMASLPSVVLGFLAALVFAPFIERLVPHTLVAFVTLPVMLLLGAHLWQLLPGNLAARLKGRKLIVQFAMLPLGLWLAAVLGQPAESLFFAGDILAWLDGQIGSGLAGWLFLLLPASGVAVAMLQSQLVNPWLRRISRNWTHRRFALVDLGRFVVGLALTGGVAALGSWFLSSTGFDPRGSYVDTYVQRNAMVVGFVMGFAIIPIIYTIAEDALSAVPEHLRAASLGAGATQWQTAVRVVIPPAMSGLFSAVMIGLGRAVGETMIVLMAAGNTPVMQWNIFNGFRTLSANIAVELPEAVQHSTHFRTLFLAALTLFAMTFVLNTVAEAVRIRFRKKAFQL